ncbi:2-C-methyl-D-erythritol 4-phosphate cytidylyltransferase [Pseudomonas sp. HK3]|jgi:2-C-methyl-D-erythritol 4-phosphate cytidylyltransferase
MSDKLYAVVPAAGIGSRMQADRPKQYLSLLNKTILEHTLNQLLGFSAFKKIVLPIAEHDEYFAKLDIARHPKVGTCLGGAERFESVLSGLKHLLETGASEDDWVMVHDVARPCITQQDLQSLFDQRNQHGAILGMQVRDTMKRCDDKGHIVKTVSREYLWHALTPQMAPIGLLKACIETCITNQHNITDEASALEYCGHQPIMVAGHPSNIKVTRPDDLMMAQVFLQEIQL